MSIQNCRVLLLLIARTSFEVLSPPFFASNNVSLKKTHRKTKVWVNVESLLHIGLFTKGKKHLALTAEGALELAQERVDELVRRARDRDGHRYEGLRTCC